MNDHFDEDGVVQPRGAVVSAVLEGEDEDLYVRRLVAIIRAARLNNQYPDARRLGAHVAAMSPQRHQGLYNGLQVNLQSGLPTYREWTRIQTDVSIAEDQLRQLGSREALAQRVTPGANPIHEKQLAKYDYYMAVKSVQLAPLGAMTVALRRVDSGQRRAHFHVVFDKLDASGVFVRYALDLSQESSVWSRPAVVLDEETAAHTEEFKAMIYRFSSLDAEFTFAQLTALAGLSVDRVSKGTVGPIYFEKTQTPDPIAGLLNEDPEGFVAMFALDTAARDVAESRNNDPFGSIFSAAVSPQVRATYARARDAYGYKVYRDRKFVTSRSLIEPLRALCAQMGTQNIVYGI